jgi:hypothetical protein
MRVVLCITGARWLLSNRSMLTLTDVTHDPHARDRSGLQDAWLDEAARLGFAPLGWTCAVPSQLPPGAIVDENLILTAVLAHRSRRAFLDMTTIELVDERGLKTVFDDGTVVNTAIRPPTFWKYRAGLEGTPARHRYDLAYYSVSSLADLFEIHEQRVRAEEARGRRVAPADELRTYLTIRKRWREIADPRMLSQQKIATAFGIASGVAGLVGMTVLARALAPSLGDAAWLIGFAGAIAALPFGFAAFVFALFFIAPRLARGAAAPPPRPLRDMLALAAEVPLARIPPRGMRSTPAIPEPVVTVALSPEALTRAQRIDMAISIADAAAIPIVGLASFAAGGAAVASVALAILFSVEGVVGVVMNRMPAALLREALVPELARASSVNRP